MPDESPAESTATPIITIVCESAQDFIHQLSPYGPNFGADQPGTWLYRGHSSSTYALLPTALRESERERLIRMAAPENWTTAARETAGYQAWLEAQALVQFVELADVAGLAVPDIGPSFLETTENLFNDMELVLRDIEEGFNERQDDSPLTESMNPFFVWPIPGLHRILALARHHSLPTRLLDWTSSPYFAAYFAAEKYATSDSSLGNLAVHALRTNQVTRFYRGEGPTFSHAQLIVPSHGNRNLIAQAGSFTCQVVNVDNFTQLVDRRPIDEVVSTSFRSAWDVMSQSTSGFDIRQFPTPAMYCVELPTSQAQEVLWLLAKQGIARHRIYPDYDSIAQAIDERACVDRISSRKFSARMTEIYGALTGTSEPG